MRSIRALLGAALAAVLMEPACPAAQADPVLPRSGTYEIIARFELPHVERWAVDHAATVCLPRAGTGSVIPVPLVSANNPFANCTAANFVTEGATLQYDIVCPERGSAKAHATYQLSANAFSGRVAMVMGAKNMTMTEIQRARRIGDCGEVVGAAGQF